MRSARVAGGFKRLPSSRQAPGQRRAAPVGKCWQNLAKCWWCAPIPAGWQLPSFTDCQNSCRLRSGCEFELDLKTGIDILHDKVSKSFLIAVGLFSATVAFAETNFTAQLMLPGIVQPTAVTTVPDVYNGAAVNLLVGAGAFYNAGIYGQGASIANVEAQHIWNGHETLTQVTDEFTGTGAVGGFGEHATAVGSLLAGRSPGFNQYAYQAGIAFYANLKSGAMATSVSGGNFNLDDVSLASTYGHFFGSTDVINSSWGDGGDPGGTAFYTMMLDGFSRNNPTTVFVAAAGNNGPGDNTVGGPAAGYNSISVGALGNANAYNQIASFSSGGPEDYWDPNRGSVADVRAAVDLVAPGESLLLASTAGSDQYSYPWAGTSFAAPIVAGSVALMDSASRLDGLAAESRDARVIKAVLMNSADKIAGWDNGQTTSNGVIVTTQGLDLYSGTGALDLNNTYNEYLTGTRDVAGLSGGTVGNVGWDYAALSGVGTYNDYLITNTIAGPMTVTLDWFRDRATNGDDNAFADLNLEVWDANFTHLIATSESQYNSAEHLSFNLPTAGNYGLRVTYNQQMFGTVGTVDYGLAWNSTAVPEPSSLLLGLLGGIGVWIYRRAMARKSAVRPTPGLRC